MMLKHRTAYFTGLISLPIIAVFCAFGVYGDTDFELAKQEILLRKIGHEILLQSGDSTSRVLPVKKITETQYQVRFENAFTFQVDSLVKIVSRTFAQDGLDRAYIVNILNCSGEVVFGYAISGNEQRNIVPCSGRKQPKNCYIVDLKFRDTGVTAAQKGYLLGSLPLLAFVGLIISRSVKSRKETVLPAGTENPVLKIGQTVFDPAKRQLMIGGLTTELTLKESKLLLIFAKSPNLVIERSRLQKEIWEDEGVIVGRSLDVFISKLRKKLENDPSLQLTNIHGKGYQLEITG